MIKAGRELDVQIAKEVFGHEVKNTKKLYIEKAPTGDRPLRAYSKDIQAAWAVAEIMCMSLLPIENGEWFAFVAGEGKRWSGPAEFIKYLQSGKFVDAGAAVGPDPALTICMAALKALEHRRRENLAIAEATPLDSKPVTN